MTDLNSANRAEEAEVGQWRLYEILSSLQNNSLVKLTLYTGSQREFDVIVDFLCDDLRENFSLILIESYPMAVEGEGSASLIPFQIQNEEAHRYMYRNVLLFFADHLLQQFEPAYPYSMSESVVLEVLNKREVMGFSRDDMSLEKLLKAVKAIQNDQEYAFCDVHHILASQLYARYDSLSRSRGEMCAYMPSSGYPSLTTMRR